jgi:hypothetical protein
MFNFYGNFMATLENLLPLGSHKPEQDNIDCERFSHIHAKSGQELIYIRPPHKVQISAFLYLYCKKYQFSSLEPISNWIDMSTTIPLFFLGALSEQTGKSGKV